MRDRRELLLRASAEVIEFTLSIAAQRAALITAAPSLALLTLARWRLAAPAFIPSPWELVGPALGGLAALLVLLGGLRVEDDPGRRLAIGGLILSALALAPTLLDAPQLAFTIFLFYGGAITWLTDPSRLDPDVLRHVHRFSASRALSAGSLAALFGWAVTIPTGLVGTWLESAVAALILVAWMSVAVPWLRQPRRGFQRWRTAALLLALGVVGIVTPLAALTSTWATLGVVAALPPLVGIIAARDPVLSANLDEDRPWWTPLVEHPARFLVGSFFATCVIGGLILSFPVCATTPGGHALLDSMFTSFSATCVTGLAVLDTPTAFSGFGQVVILLLIQVGGLGIMAFSTTTFLLLGQRMSLRHEAAVAELIGSSGRDSLATGLKRMLGVTFVTEALGAVALTLLFIKEGDGLGTALWRGVFTSISAFCNAGFALQSDSLISYNDNPLLLLVVSLIIIAGALSPAAVVALPWALRRRRRVSSQALMIYAVTAALTFGPFLFIAAAEWGNTLGGMAVVDKIANAWFQSVTLRTAGFNSIDLAAVQPATLTLMDVVMFIGGSPGSTAGGVKTTTLMILLLAINAALRGKTAATFAGTRIPHASVYKAAAITTLGALSIFVALLLLQLTQDIPLQDALFEAISALATVGLSIGATGKLDGVGKVIVIVCMFMGRVGPLTLFLLLASPDTRTDWKLPEQEIAVG